MKKTLPGWISLMMVCLILFLLIREYFVYSSAHDFGGDEVCEAPPSLYREFNDKNLRLTEGWLANLLVECEKERGRARLNAESEVDGALNKLKGRPVSWEFALLKNCPWGVRSLPIHTGTGQRHHLLFVSMVAKDGRPPVEPDPVSSDASLWDVRVIALIPGKDASTQWCKDHANRDTEIRVDGTVESAEYVPAGSCSYMKIYLKDCVPRVAEAFP